MVHDQVRLMCYEILCLSTFWFPNKTWFLQNNIKSRWIITSMDYGTCVSCQSYIRHSNFSFCGLFSIPVLKLVLQNHFCEVAKNPLSPWNQLAMLFMSSSMGSFWVCFWTLFFWSSWIGVCQLVNSSIMFSLCGQGKKDVQWYCFILK